jgi:hypothetical protein
VPVQCGYNNWKVAVFAGYYRASISLQMYISSFTETDGRPASREQNKLQSHTHASKQGHAYKAYPNQKPQTHIRGVKQAAKQAAKHVKCIVLESPIHYLRALFPRDALAALATWT